MKKLSVAAAVSVALSSIFAAPVAAQEIQVAIPYGDLNLATASGVETLNGRIEAGIKSACERPDMRDLKSMAAWEQCKDVAESSAAEQLARITARVNVVAAAN